MANGQNAVAVNNRNQNQLTPVQRAQLFSMSTRQNWQQEPVLTAQPNSTISFDIPKVRLLSRIRLLVEATLTATHASQNTFTPKRFAPYSLLRNVRVDANNGFSPWSVSGMGAYLHMLCSSPHASQLVPVIGSNNQLGRARAVMGNEASASGKDNTIRFVVDLPIALNDRDPIGLILAQNQETLITVTVDVGDASDLVADSSGYTLDLSNVKITPLVESFSIPPDPRAIPDLGTLKLVQELRERSSGGVHHVRLPVGLTYRRLIFYIEDENSGAPLRDDQFGGPFRLLFNQADNPYRISPTLLAAINQEQYRQVLPEGVYAFDFSYQGIPNYGGSRDYVDTERLTEFWLEFSYAQAAQVRVIYETLSRLA